MLTCFQWILEHLTFKHLTCVSHRYLLGCKYYKQLPITVYRLSVRLCGVTILQCASWGQIFFSWLIYQFTINVIVCNINAIVFAMV